MVDVVHESINEQAGIRTWPPADFCGFRLEHAVHIHPMFQPCPLNVNVARRWNGHSSSHFQVSTAVEQVVACAVVTQRARVRFPAGQVFWVRFFRGFSSPVRRMSGSFRPTRSPNIIWPS